MTTNENGLQPVRAKRKGGTIGKAAGAAAAGLVAIFSLVGSADLYGQTLGPLGSSGAGTTSTTPSLTPVADTINNASASASTGHGFANAYLWLGHLFELRF